MDIEGSEQNALKGAAKTLKEFKPKLSVAVYHKKDDFDIIPALIRQIRPDYQAECGPIFSYNNKFYSPTYHVLPLNLHVILTVYNKD